MRVRHEIQSTVFDDPNIVSCAGLVPVVALAERAGLHKLIREPLQLPGVAGSNPVTKVVALMAGMVAGADVTSQAHRSSASLARQEERRPRVMAAVGGPQTSSAGEALRPS